MNKLQRNTKTKKSQLNEAKSQQTWLTFRLTLKHFFDGTEIQKNLNNSNNLKSATKNLV